MELLILIKYTIKMALMIFIGQIIILVFSFITKYEFQTIDLWILYFLVITYNVSSVCIQGKKLKGK